MDPSAEFAADDTVAMELAIAEARLAGAAGDVPVGAVVVADWRRRRETPQ